MNRIHRGPAEERRVLLRKARAFAVRGEDHLAELHINHALELQAPLDEVNAALDDLAPRHATFTRRDALRRASMLLGAGMLVGPGFLGDWIRTTHLPPGEDTTERLAVSTTTGGGLAGLFLKVPSLGLGDGTYTLVPVGPHGLLPGLGPYLGHTLAQGGLAYNVSQSWTTGTVATDVTVLDNSGPTVHFVLTGASTTQGASTVESETTAIKVGSLLYCSHTWMRVFTGPGELSGDKAGTPVVRLTSTPTLEIIDLEARSRVASWLGPELDGACRASLKVSTDGSGILLATDIPGAGEGAPSLHWFRFEGQTLSPLASMTPEPSILVGLLGRDYYWPSAETPLLGVSPVGVHLVSPANQRQSVMPLPVQYGNNRQTPLWQGAFLADGTPVVGSGDGRLFHGTPGAFHANVEAMPSIQTTTVSADTVSPPFLVYQGSRLDNVFAVAGDNVWMVDNREGVGGVWQLDQQQQPVAHHLAGNYISAVTTDGSGSYLACLSPLESVLYLVGPDSSVAAFATAPFAELVGGSPL